MELEREMPGQKPGTNGQVPRWPYSGLGLKRGFRAVVVAVGRFPTGACLRDYAVIAVVAVVGVLAIVFVVIKYPLPIPIP